MKTFNVMMLGDLNDEQKEGVFNNFIKRLLKINKENDTYNKIKKCLSEQDLKDINNNISLMNELLGSYSDILNNISRDEERQIMKVYDIIKDVKSEKLKEKLTETEKQLHKVEDKISNKKDKDNATDENDPQRFFINNSFKPALLKEEILSEYKIISVPQIGYFLFNGKYWEKIDEEFIICIAEQKLGVEVKGSMINEILNLSRGFSMFVPVDKIDANKNKFALLNGTIDLTNWNDIKFYENKWFPEDYCTKCLNVNYNPNAKHEVWDKYLKTTFENDKNIQLLLGEMFGYCLTAETRLEACFVLTGKGGNGKSISLNALKEIIGIKNIASVKMSAMKNPFSRAILYNKTLNLCTEINAKSFDTDDFKGLVSGEPIQASFKGKDEFIFENYAKMIFACNELPNVSDNTDGYWRRLQIIPFEHTFSEKEKDTHLNSKIKKELDGIFMWALEGLKRLAENDELFTYCDSSNKIKNTYKEDSRSSVELFIEENIVFEENEEAESTELYKLYEEYCKENGYKGIYNESNFGKEFKNKYPQIEKVRKTIDGKRKYVYKGAKIA